jgi:hypothetical protein
MNASTSISITPVRVALDPELVWLAHEHEPWQPRTV